MKHLALTIIWLCVLLVSPVAGQTSTPAIPVSIDVQVLPQTGDPVTIPPIASRTSPISQGSADCNLAPPPPPPTPLVNPKWVYFDDPYNIGRKCRAQVPAQLPDGMGYRAVGVFTAAGTCDDGTGTILNPCQSVRSSVGIPPFNIQPVQTRPAAPTNLVVSP
jgi:hypothetical protein